MRTLFETFQTSYAFTRVHNKLGSRTVRLWVTAPLTSQRTPFEKDSSSYSRSIFDGKSLHPKNDASSRDEAPNTVRIPECVASRGHRMKRLYGMLGSANYVFLYGRVQIYEESTISGHSNNQVLILLWVFLRISERVRGHHVAL